MKVKNVNIVEILQFLNGMTNKRLPQKISFAIIKNISIFQKDYEIYQAALRKIVEDYSQYAEVGEDGNIAAEPNGLPALADEEKRAEMYNAVNTLLNIEVEIDKYAIDEELFNYDDEKYDVLSTGELSDLIKILS